MIDAGTSPQPTRAERRRRRQSVWKRWRRAIGRRIVLVLAPPLIRIHARTLRPILEGRANYDAALGASESFILVFWHGRMLVPLTFHDAKRFAISVSRSDDGETATELVQRFGYGTLRGSTRDGALSLISQQLDAIARRVNLVVTPDGPRGPLHTVPRGLLHVARESGVAILPCGFVARRAWHLRSWDRFTIPKPFSRIAFVYGEPIRVAKDADEVALERLATDVRDAILRAERRGFELLGVEPDG